MNHWRPATTWLLSGALLGFLGVSCGSPARVKTDRTPFAGLIVVVDAQGWEGLTLVEEKPKSPEEEQEETLRQLFPNLPRDSLFPAPPEERSFLSDLINSAIEVSLAEAPYPRIRVIGKDVRRCSFVVNGPDGRSILHCGDPPWDLRVPINRPGRYVMSLEDEGESIHLGDAMITTAEIHRYTVSLLPAGKINCARSAMSHQTEVTATTPSP